MRVIAGVVGAVLRPTGIRPVKRTALEGESSLKDPLIPCEGACLQWTRHQVMADTRMYSCRICGTARRFG